MSARMKTLLDYIRLMKKASPCEQVRTGREHRSNKDPAKTGPTGLPAIHANAVRGSVVFPTYIEASA